MQLQLVDIEKIYAALDGLEDVEKDRVVRTGIRKGATILKRAGECNITSRVGRYSKGSLLKSITIRNKRNKLGSLVGFIRSTKWFGLEDLEGVKIAGNHAHLVDMGTVQRKTKSGANRGRMPANHFWTDAINNNKDKALSEITNAIEKAINRIKLRN